MSGEAASGEAASGEAEVAGTTLDLADAVEAGDIVSWTVAAVDAWGEGPESAPVQFTVVAAPVAPEGGDTPEATGGCASAPGGAGSALLVGVAAACLSRCRTARSRRR